MENREIPLEQIFAHESAYWTCTAEIEQRTGWKLFHNRRFRGRIDPNHAGEFRAADGAGPTVAREIVAFYQALDTPPAAYVDALTTPRDLAHRLVEAGFQAWLDGTSDLMLYEGPDEARPSSVQVELAATAQARAEWASLVAEEIGAESARQMLHEMYATQIADPRMTAYLIRLDGVPACRCQLFSSQGLGRVEAVRTAMPYRRRGLAAAVVRRAVADSFAQGNRVTYIYAEPGGAAQRLYHQLGFRTAVQNAIQGFIK